MPNTPSLKNRRVYEALRRKGMSKQRAARISNAMVQKDAGVTGMAIPPTGQHALFNQMGIASRRRRRRKETCSCGLTTKAVGAPGEKIAPGITRIRGNLCNVHGRYGPCDKSLSGKKKPAKGRKPPKPKQTPEQRAAQRQQQRQQNADAVAQRMADTDTGLSPSGSKALLAFARGEPPDSATGEQLAKMGLAEQASDGSYRMTPTGRAAASAMQAGDYQRAVDTISRATDQAGKRTERQTAATKRQQDAAAKRTTAQVGRELSKRERAAAQAKRAAERAAKKPSKVGGGSGSGGSKKPSAQAKPARVASRRARRSSGGGAAAGSSSFSGSPKPKPPAPKPEKPAKPQIAPALRDAATALSEGAELSDKQVQALITNGLVKLNKDGVPILTAAGQRATMKESSGHTGVMIALYPDAAAAKQIAAQDGVTEPIDELHLTLAFLGDSSETPLSSNKDKLIAAVKQWATEKGQTLKGTMNGLGRFFHSEDDDTNAVFVSPDVPGLPELRQSLVDWIEQSGFDYAQNHGFTPHITVAYVPLDAPTPDIRVESPIVFDQVTLAWGDERYDYPLGQRATTKAQTQEDKAMFAKMGGGGSGGSGGGGGGASGGSKLWPKGPSGKRTPQAAAAQSGGGGAKPAVAGGSQTPTKGDAKQALQRFRKRTDDAKAKTSQAYKLESQASQARSAGDKGRASDLQRQADTLRSDARKLELHPDSRRDLKTIEDAGFRLNSSSSGIVPAKHSTTPKIKESPAVFAVFKDSRGADRWLGITTTAYLDVDDEIISTKAIGQAVAIGDLTNQRGPLRYWHVPGLDIGDCDYQAQGGPGGRFLIESGTFRSKACARLGQRMAEKGYQMSPGFVHARSQPRNGIYDDIAIYERSPVPNGRAANRFTKFSTKENRMLTTEKEAELKTLLADQPDLLNQLMAQVEHTDKAAQAIGVTYKDAPPAPALPTEIEIGGVVYTVKAFAPADAAEEVAEDVEDEVEEVVEEETDEAGMDDQQFAQLIAQAVVQAITPLLDIEKKMAGHLNDFKTAVGGAIQQKDDTQKAQAEQIAALEAKLKELTGDLPSSVLAGAAQLYRPSQAPATLLTTESAAKVKEGLAQVPAGLSDPNEIGAYKLIWPD